MSEYQYLRQFQHYQSQKPNEEAGSDQSAGQDDPVDLSWQHSGHSQPQKRRDDFRFRGPQFGEDTRRLLVAVRNDDAGLAFFQSLRESQDRLGFIFAGTLGELLLRAEVENGGAADEMSDIFAFLDILPGYDFPVMNSILRHGCNIAPLGSPIADIDIESDLPMTYSGQPVLGNNYTLRSPGSMHDTYLNMLRIPRNRSAPGLKIVVIDSGFEKPGVVTGYLDLVEPGNKVEKDKFGHGTAMATIIADVARGASIYSIRASDIGPSVSEAMLGISAGLFYFKPDILNLSFGLTQGRICPTCGSGSSVSRVFYRFLTSLSEVGVSPGGPPILIAATGNGFSSQGFDAPACWDFTLAVGSMNASMDRSSFSNYGSPGKYQYIVMPGGEESQQNATEWVGEAAQKCYGTSVSAAYASAVVALHMANQAQQISDRSAFLKGLLGNCLPCNNQSPAEHGLGYLPL